MCSRFLAAMLALAALASCAPRPAPPAPPPPAPQPQVEPPRPAPPPPAEWEDAPLSPGDWTYRSEGGSSAASFGSGGTAMFVLRCESDRRVTLSLAGAARPPLIVRTSYGARSVAAEPRQGGLVARLAASDALLDQIVFSRGRFAVEAEGAARLILPAWAEPARVIEDCRR